MRSTINIMRGVRSQIAVGMLGLGVIVTIMLATKKFRSKTAYSVVLGFWILIMILGVPAIVALSSGDMRQSAGGMPITTVFALASAFCVTAPLVQYVVLNRNRSE